ncbi:MAG: APC family permease [Ferruginibacter sp.]|nr:APC family permease [Ferruginibacter sp.]
MEPASKNEHLKREIGLRSLVLAIVNITAGSGIFVIPAIIAEGLGATAILAYVVCGVLIFLIGLCFAEVGSQTYSSGGSYTYIERAFGPFAGFMSNNIYWIGGCIFSDAAIANALADTLKYFFPALGGDWFRAVFLFLVFGGLALLNIRSVKNGIRFVEFATLGKLIPMIVLIIAGAAFVDQENLTWTTAPTIANIGTASLLLFFAFLGFEGPLTNGGEIRQPNRTVPLGIFLGVTTVLILYISIQLVTQGVLGTGMSAHKDAPLAAVAGIAFGKTGTILIVAVTALSMLGALGGEMLSIPRILFAGARDGLMPQPLARVHPRFATPHVAIIFYAGLGFLFAISGGFKQLAILASAAVLITYLGVVLASVKLRNATAPGKGKDFRVPGGVIVPLFATAGIIWLLSNLTKQELTGIAVFIVVFSLIYLVVQYIKKSRVKTTTA